MNHDENKILPFALREEGKVTKLWRRGLRLMSRAVRLSEALLHDPHTNDATLDLIVQTIDRMLLAERQLRVRAAEEQQQMRDVRRASRLN
jgi:hypothetical protein